MSTPPRPPDSQRSAPTTAPGLLARWKATEPVRLYGYAVLAAVLVALGVAGAVSEDLSAALTGVAAALLGVVPAVEASRLSVYSPAGHVAAVLDADQTAQSVQG